MANGAPATDGDTLFRWRDAVRGLYPESDAEGWDQVGLHIGDPMADVVTGVLVALDVTDAVLDEAAELGANLVVAHHPLLFSPLARLTPATATGRLALRAARQGCAVIAAHTNVDKAVDGTSHPAARALDLRETKPLVPLDRDPGETPVKLVTFVPRDHTDAVLAAAAGAAPGVGTIGEYTECAFLTTGTGTFRPGEGATPHVGQPGQRERVEEDRVEMVLPRRALAAVREALDGAHPYEEVPLDVYPLIVDAPAPTRGLGLVGRLPEPLPLRRVAELLAAGLPSPHLRLAAEEPDREVSTVAICGGAGDSLIRRLLDADGRPTVDLFVTGDLKHHPVLDALTMGLALIDAGHFPTENPAMDDVLTRLEAARPSFGLTAPLHRSTVNTDPWIHWKAPQ